MLSSFMSLTALIHSVITSERPISSKLSHFQTGLLGWLKINNWCSELVSVLIICIWYLITSHTRVCMLLCKLVMMLKLSTEEVIWVSGSAAKLGHREWKPLECWGFAGPLSMINTIYHAYSLMSSTWMVSFVKKSQVNDGCILNDTGKVQLYVGT